MTSPMSHNKVIDGGQLFCRFELLLYFWNLSLCGDHGNHLILQTFSPQIPKVSTMSQFCTLNLSILVFPIVLQNHFLGQRFILVENLDLFFLVFFLQGINIKKVEKGIFFCDFFVTFPKATIKKCAHPHKFTPQNNHQGLLIKMISHQCDFYMTYRNNKAQSEDPCFTFRERYSPFGDTMHAGEENGLWKLLV